MASFGSGLNKIIITAAKCVWIIPYYGECQQYHPMRQTNKKSKEVVINTKDIFYLMKVSLLTRGKWQRLKSHVRKLKLSNKKTRED